jgi:hypothetical protein
VGANTHWIGGRTGIKSIVHATAPLKSENPWILRGRTSDYFAFEILSNPVMAQLAAMTIAKISSPS